MAEHQPTHTQPEEWRPVLGYEGRYEVSNYGKVKSIPRLVTGRNGVTQRVAGGMKKPTANLDGHFQTMLYRDNKYKRVYVHQLVLVAFVGPRPDGMVGCHNDGNPANNHVSNLRWDTIKSNAQDMIKHGQNFYRNKKNCNRGHILSFPNLVPSRAKNGHRSCLACQRTHSRVGRNPSLKVNFQEISDSYYAAIMEKLST